jgi:hypothetical protein
MLTYFVSKALINKTRIISIHFILQKTEHTSKATLNPAVATNETARSKVATQNREGRYLR